MSNRLVRSASFLVALSVGALGYGAHHDAAAHLKIHPRHLSPLAASGVDGLDRMGLIAYANPSGPVAEDTSFEGEAESEPAVYLSDEMEPEREESVAPEAILSDESTQVPSNFLGRVDLRPSWTTMSGEFHTENMMEVGWKLTPDIAAYYQQNFQTNLYDPHFPTNKGMDAFAQDGLVRVRFNNVWVNDAQNLYVNYEPRVFFPTYAPDRDAGMITAVRNYFIVKQTVSPVLTLSAMEIPIVHFYNRAGFAGTANPLFENRVYLIADINVTRKFALSFPIQIKSVRYRNYATGARRNDSWGHKIWIWPEVSYQVTPVMQVGAAYYTDNLIAPDFSNSAFDSGFEQGVAQMFVRASI